MQCATHRCCIPFSQKMRDDHSCDKNAISVNLIEPLCTSKSPRWQTNQLFLSCHGKSTLVHLRVTNLQARTLATKWHSLQHGSAFLRHSIAWPVKSIYAINQALSPVIHPWVVGLQVHEIQTAHPPPTLPPLDGLMPV